MMSKTKIEKPDWQKLCEECSTAMKEAGLTKADTDRIIKETKEIQAKANKYDSLVNKMKDKKKELRDNYINSNGKNITYLELRKKEELLEELLKEVENG